MHSLMRSVQSWREVIGQKERDLMVINLGNFSVSLFLWKQGCFLPPGRGRVPLTRGSKALLCGRRARESERGLLEYPLQFLQLKTVTLPRCPSLG